MNRFAKLLLAAVALGALYVGPAAAQFVPTQFVNAQTGTSYTVVNTDCSKLVTFSNSGAQAVTLPQAGTAGIFAAGCFIDVFSKGTGTVTITPTTSTINGSASTTLTQYTGTRIVSDGTNYQIQRGTGAGAGGTGAGSFTTTTSTGSATIGTGSAASVVIAGAASNPTITVSSGSLSIPSGVLITGTLGTTGTASIGTASTNSITIAGSGTNPVINTTGGSLAITPATIFAAGITVTTTNTSGNFITTASTVPANGMYLPTANKVGFASNTVLQASIDSTGHLFPGIGTGTPSIASGNCGATSNGSITAGSTDHSGSITIGAAATTSCQVDFGSTWATAPKACLITAKNSAAIAATTLPYISAISTTSFTMTIAVGASTNWYYHCI